MDGTVLVILKFKRFESVAHQFWLSLVILVKV